MMYNKTPIYLAGGAAYPYSEPLAERFTLESRFGEPYELFWRNPKDDTLWIPRNCFTAKHDYEDARVQGESVGYECRFVPRKAEQGEIVDEAVKLLQDWQSFIIQAPTGWGKTYVGCAIAGRMQRKTLVITTKEDIIEQWFKAAREVLGLDASEIDLWRGDDEPAPDAKFVVALVQSVMKGPERYPNVDFDSFGLVVCDEVHRMAADQFAKSMWWFRAALRMGLSATPYRKDGKEGVFIGHIGPVRLTATQEVMVPKVIIRHSEFKLPIVRRPTAGGVWRSVKLPHTARKVGHVIKHLAKCESRNAMIGRFAGACYRKERNLIIFSDTLDHLAAIEEVLHLSGVPEEDIGYYVGTSAGSGVYNGNAKERKAQREQAKIKSVILATYAMASEATDIPWLDACVLASPRSDVIQIVGRIRREYPDKKQPVVLDIVDADSPVFLAYAKKRVKWYQSLGCEILVKS